jgi:hypothetical protein
MLKSKSTFDVRKALAFRSAGVRCGLTPARWPWQRAAGHLRFSTSRETIALGMEFLLNIKKKE